MKDEETGLEVHSVPSTGLRSTTKEADRIARDNRNREVLDELFAVIGGSPAIKGEETGLLHVGTASIETAPDGKYPPMTHYAQYWAIGKTAWGMAR